MLAGRTTALDAFDIWSPMLTNNPSLCNENLRARMEVANVELFRGDARLVPRYAATATYGNGERRIQRWFSALRKKEEAQGTIL